MSKPLLSLQRWAFVICFLNLFPAECHFLFLSKILLVRGKYFFPSGPCMCGPWSNPSGPMCTCPSSTGLGVCHFSPFTAISVSPQLSTNANGLLRENLYKLSPPA